MDDKKKRFNNISKNLELISRGEDFEVIRIENEEEVYYEVMCKDGTDLKAIIEPKQCVISYYVINCYDYSYNDKDIDICKLDEMRMFINALMKE